MYNLFFDVDSLNPVDLCHSFAKSLLLLFLLNGKVSAEKMDRKTIERNRRIHMKDLCYKLTSLIPPQHLTASKGMLSISDQLDQAATYIKKLKEKVAVMKSRKKLLMRDADENGSGNGNSRMLFRDFDYGFEVVGIVSTHGMKNRFMLCEIITILEEEGAEVINASVSTVGDKAFHTLHAQVRVSRVGVDSSSLCERLQELISET